MEAPLLQFSGTFPTILFENNISFRSQVDEKKNFIEVNGSDHLNMIFNELIENMEQMNLKNRKQSDIRSLFRS